MAAVQVGIFFDSMQGPVLIQDRLLRGLAQFIRTADHWRGRAFTGTDREIVKDLGRARCDAAIVVSNSTWLDAQLRDLKLPLVYVRTPPLGSKAPSVQHDHRAIGKMGAEYLLKQGFRSFGFCGIAAENSQARRKGFEEAVHNAGYSCKAITVRGNFWATREFTEDLDWLAKLGKPVGVMAFNDGVAVGLIEAAMASGLDVPGNVAVLGVDNNLFDCTCGAVPVSSIDLNMPAMGFEAGQLLAKVIARRRVARVKRMPPDRIVPRRSTEFLAVADPDVRRAIEYIDQQAGAGIRVRDVMRHLTMSRSTLERRFIEQLGRAPATEIRRARIRKAQEFLTETDLKLAEIAERCGFGYLSSFTHAFTRATGDTPSRYRREHLRRA